MKGFEQAWDAIKDSGRKIRQTLSILADSESFVETEAFTFSVEPEGDAAGEGVVTGYCEVDGQRAYVWAHNGEVLKGAVSLAQAEKIARNLRAASRAGVPVISIIDTYGSRISEPVDSMDGLALILDEMSALDVPHIAVFKHCYGMLSAAVCMADFNIFYADAEIATASPLVLTRGEKVKSAPFIGGAAYSKNNGFCDLTVKDDGELRKAVAALLRIINDGNSFADDPNRPFEGAAGAEMDKLAENVFDTGSRFEIMKDYGSAAVTAFFALDSVTVGVVSAGTDSAKYLSPADCDKISRFVSVCADLDIPVITLVDVAGTDGTLENQAELIASMAAVFSAYKSLSANISVITGSAVGFGYTAFCSRRGGADYVLAYPDAKISALTDEGSARLMYKDEISKGGKSGDAVTRKLAKVYGGENSAVLNPARKGAVDNIIDPRFTRQYLISILGMLLGGR